MAGGLTMIPQASESGDVRGAFRTIRIIHLAMCATVLIYGVFVYLMLTRGIIPGGGFASDFPNLNLFRTILFFIAAGVFLAIRLIKARFLAVEALLRRAVPLVHSINTWYIVMFALAEAIAIYGLLLFLIAALLQDFLVLAGISLLVLYWLRPKEDEYHALVRQVLRP